MFLLELFISFIKGMGVPGRQLPPHPAHSTPRYLLRHGPRISRQRRRAPNGQNARFWAPVPGALPLDL